ncbi:MAG: thioredoxin [Gallionellales bacterium RIFCSPLOWO2_12_FULL_59_22]|nr:MAG: thioredoxin [Gallionellales bacterium RIFCSPLOWO2_02_FULL_59_110]OGT05585.1 MAG: thioredoxin [Gallionellales bacterium RIFCSPLOWO2_02_58_13]OGT14746.1 MAG: thioredoxin [Gallionellales bacterium RIFCSPLOWO2_12_FULL_59_22]
MTNELAQETSPYLQQHAGNPVDWHAWNPETLRLAREQDKPILLSIGYSACHWCHVMAHESFEDTEVAALMNKHFINIKVDREERPDLDQIYQTAHQLLMQRGGGWPLTMFLSPDGTPFFGGTYFPKEARYNLPGFTDLLQRIARAYAENRSELAAQGKQLIAALAGALPPVGATALPLDAEPLALAVRQLGEDFDGVNGGFGDAPKFLHPAELDLLLRRSHAAAEEESRHIVQFTLRQMAQGGLYDQLGGGFCRYCVDAQWSIPHFEKMLYDNGLLLGLYGAAWQSSGEPLFARVVEQTAAWVMREMQSFEGGYYSSLDADSEHKEGKFYVWQRDEIRRLLSADEYALIAPYYGLDGPPNFEQRAWHLRIKTPLDEIAQRLQLSAEQAAEQLAAGQAKLFAARGQRIRPGRDEKILGTWNGLMIAGMARAARIFDRPDWLHSAQGAMDFARGTLWRDGRLLATYKDGKAHLNAYLDDHAFLLNAALELLQAEFRNSDLAFAVQLADALLARFEDSKNGGFFFTSHDHEALIQRSKTGHDDATPSGNGIAAQALLRLAQLTGDSAYARAAERCLKSFSPALRQAAGYHCSLCTALAEYLQPAALLVLSGNDVSVWQAALRTRYLPDVMMIVLPENAADLPRTLDKPASKQTTAWLCQGARCLAPITDLDELLESLIQAQDRMTGY